MRPSFAAVSAANQHEVGRDADALYQLNVCSQHTLNRTPLCKLQQRLHYLLRTNRTLTVLVSLQPVNAHYSSDADARDQ